MSDKDLEAGDASVSAAASDGNDGGTVRIEFPSDASISRTVFGLLLIAVGAASLIERVLDIDITIFPLAVGLILLYLWNQKRSRPLMIAGWIVTGSGLGIFLQSMIHSFSASTYFGTSRYIIGGGAEWIDALPLLGLAVGFFAIYVFDRTRPAWAAITAAILGAISGGRIIASTLEIFFPQIRELVFPLVLIGLGIFFIVRAVGRSGS